MSAPRPGRTRRALGPLRRWWAGAGVQVRSTVAATALQAVVVAASGLVLLLALHHSLESGIDATNSATAQDLAILVTGDLAAGTAGTADRADLQNAIDAAAGRRAVVQVLGADGSVVAASDDLGRRPALLRETPGPGATVVRQFPLPFDDDPYRFTALGGEVDGERFTVLVGESLGTGEDTLHTAVAALAVAGPVLLLAVAGATHLFIGRSLLPVARIRARVEGISHRDLSERVPVPPGRDEVSELARTMNAMLTRLEAATATQRQFVSDASHELRSPVATLRAAADIALSVPDRPQGPALPLLVRDEATRLDRLVADLLQLARLDEAGPRPAPGPAGADVRVGPGWQEVDLDDLVTVEARRLSTSTTLRVSARRGPARVRGDADALARVLRNLGDNAVRHAVSAVRIEVRRAGGTAVLEVANDGSPIAAADRERVFGRFVRLEESRARDLGGSGLGLAIVQAVVLAHGGSVEVVDVPPADRGAPAGAARGGTCFRVVLPLADPADDDPADDDPADDPDDDPADEDGEG